MSGTLAAFCERCDAAGEEPWSGWCGLHDPEVHDRLVAAERALDNLIDALLHSEDWEVDAAFWMHRLSELESRQS